MTKKPEDKIRQIPFSPPQITSQDIKEVVSVLKSGWITTGNKVKEFQNALCNYTKAKGVLCVNSATAGMEIILMAFEIGPGDEVITTPYTFTATASIIHHVGAKIVLADTEPGSFNISPDEIRKKITAKTKAVIAVDIAGISCDYDKIKEVILEKASIYNPKKNTFQENFKSCILIDDASHSLGGGYKGVKCGAIADFSVFSFHAVKNITTAEGGAILVRDNKDIPVDKILNSFRLYSLHGQNSDSFMRLKTGWEYDIIFTGYKFNMPDIQAALGLSQMMRIDEILSKRKKLFERYFSKLKKCSVLILPEFGNEIENSYHLFPVRIKGYEEEQRNNLIKYLKEQGVNVNVHFKPLPLFTAYKNLGFSIKDFPNAYSMYKNVITLPLHLKLSISDVDYICSKFIKGVASIK